jgi:hypothetical protein
VRWLETGHSRVQRTSTEELLRESLRRPSDPSGCAETRTRFVLRGENVSQAAILSDARKGGSAGGKEAQRPSGWKRSRPASDGLRVVSSIDCSQSQTSREHLPSSSLSGGGTRGGRTRSVQVGMNHLQRGNAWQARNVSIQKPMGASSRVRRKRRTRATDSPVEESPEVGDTHGDRGNTVDDARSKRRERHTGR